MKKRLIVTGARGFVAGSVVRQSGAEWEVHAMVREAVPFQRDSLTWHTLDLLDTACLEEVFHRIKPDAVIHAAAVADIDYCEKNKQVAEDVNVGVTRQIADLCRESGARLVHLSTDTVFDGVKGNYTEEDPPGPVNFYAETKIKAENIIREEVPGAAIPRLALVMGFPAFGVGNSFLSRMLAVWKEGRQQGVPDEEIRSPVDVITLARALLELATNDFSGFIHLAGNNIMNRYDMSLRIAERMGYPPDLVAAKNPSGIPGRAPRPLDVSLNNAKARSVLKTPMLGLDDALTLLLDDEKPNRARK